MNLNEAAGLLLVSKERVKLAIEEGVKTPRSEILIRLRACELPHGYDIAQEDLDAFIAAFETEEPSRHPPVAVRRELLIECGYKCAICRDSGPLQFHHVLEWAKISHHDPEQMLAICANCHGKITRYGEPDFMAQKEIKRKLIENRKSHQVSAQTVIVDPFASTGVVDVGAMPTSTATNKVSGSTVPAGQEQPQAPRTAPSRTSLKLSLPIVYANTFEQTMRMIFNKEIAYNGPSPEEIEWVGALLFAKIPTVEIPEHCLMLARAMRAIAQIQRITHPDVSWTDWTYTDRLIEVTANVLSEMEYDLEHVVEQAGVALTVARARKLLQFEDIDEWHPGMASGTGWVEKVSLSLIGEKLLRKADAAGGY